MENRFGDSTHLDNNTGSSQRPNTSSTGSQLGGVGGGPGSGLRAQTSSGGARQKSPTPAIQLKVFSKEKLEESLQAIKV